jgi:PPOX class probable FMN-dependent enzyme
MIVSRQKIETLSELRTILGDPRPINLLKTIHHLDDTAKEFIAHSPFCLIASYNQDDNYLDVSPKGDAPGFVMVEDTQTLIFPERPGNKLVASFTNILSNPIISIIFMIPGKKETLRIRGSASIIVDPKLAQNFIVNNKAPELLLEIKVRDLYFHCAKCMMRSRIWQPDSWPNTEHLPSLSQILARYGKQEHLYEQINDAVNNNYNNNLY